MRLTNIYGHRYNKNWRFGKWRYTMNPLIDGTWTTYYRPFWGGLKANIKWKNGINIGIGKIIIGFSIGTE